MILPNHAVKGEYNVPAMRELLKQELDERDKVIIITRCNSRGTLFACHSRYKTIHFSPCSFLQIQSEEPP